MHYAKERAFWDTRGDVDYVSLSRFDQERISAWIGAVPSSARCLDIGGGSGMVPRLFPEAARPYFVCTDISREMLRHSPVAAVQGDALRLPFRSGSFDLVVAAAFIHHLPGRELEVLRECARVLRPAGRIVGYDPSRKCLQNRIFMGDGPLRLRSFSPDERPVDPETLCAQLHEAGFRGASSHLFSFHGDRLTPFEIVQRWILNPLARGPFEKTFQRWFFWSAQRR